MVNPIVMCFLVILFMYSLYLLYDHFQYFKLSVNSHLQVQDLSSNLIYVDNNLKDLIPNDKTSLIVFYVTWCGYCKMLLSSNVLQKVANDYPVFMINADKDANYDVSRYPTIYKGTCTNQSKWTEFHGKKTVKNLSNFIIG